MINLVKVLTCSALVSLLSGSLVACGVTSEVVTTHPNPSSAIGPVSSATPASEATEVPEEGGRPRARRPASSGAATSAPVRPAALVVAPAARPAVPAGAKPAAIPASTPIVRNMRTQSGRIIDEAGQPLVGATVLLKGTSVGASTDANGDYSLAVPLGTNTFVFAYTGYTDEVAQSRDGQPLTVTLLPMPGQGAAAPEPSAKTRQPKIRQRKSSR